jgi:uncharacterized protein (AIM24 family)
VEYGIWNKGSANMAEKVRLRSSDGRVFEADVKAVMSHSRVLKNVIEDTGTDAVISLPDMPGDVLELVIVYCECRSKLELPKWLGVFVHDPLGCVL